MIKFLKYIFYFTTLFLIIISFYPGSLVGYLLYGDFSKQPNLIKNPYDTTIFINHFIAFFFVSMLGFFLYLRTKNFQKLVYALFFLSVILELVHLIIPGRSFQVGDLSGNIFGVVVAYSVVKIYLLFNKS